jgi:hypothetical protein
MGLEGGVIVNEEIVIGMGYLVLTIWCCILVVYLCELIYGLEKSCCISPQ